MKNLLKEKMLKGEKPIGMFHELSSASAVECIKYGGMDYVVIDTEHGPGDVESTLEYIRAAKGQELTPLVRVKDGSRNSILKMLDIGAMGLIIPNVRSLEEAEKIVSYGKYYPVGERGVAPTAGSSYWFADYAQQGMSHYFEVSNAESLILPQCETRGCLEQIEEIAALEGIDGIFVGPYDLSVALGIPGEFDKQELIDALNRVVKACKDNNKFSIIYAGNIDAARKNYEQGFDSVTYGMDAIALVESVKSIITKIFEN
ncbi:MAG: hypothetical protein GX995_11370 [Clostridiales bacterium]|nr:hypothetical protein [Clostridiales bacterium]